MNNLGNAIRIASLVGGIGLGVSGCAGVYVEGGEYVVPGRSSANDQCRRTEELVNGRLTVTAEQCRERRQEEVYRIVNGQRVRITVERTCDLYRRLVNGTMQTVSRECQDSESVRAAPDSYYQRPHYSPPPYRHRRSCNILKRGFNCSSYDPEDSQDGPSVPLDPGFQPYYEVRYRDDAPSA